MNTYTHTSTQTHTQTQTSTQSSDLDLICAYMGTNYFINGYDIPLKINIFHVDLPNIYNKYNVKSSAYITAYNPYSELKTIDENTNNNLSLKKLLINKNYNFIEGIGSHPSNEWEGEPSFLILGIGRDDATEIGILYKQNAILWCGNDCAPQLILCNQINS
jgi:hypothetical protein